MLPQILNAKDSAAPTLLNRSDDPTSKREKLSDWTKMAAKAQPRARLMRRPVSGFAPSRCGVVEIRHIAHRDPPFAVEPAEL